MEPVLHSPGRGPTPHTGLTWESFGASALSRLVGLLALTVVVLGVLTGSWEVALTTARVALVVLLVLASWLYIVWFRRRHAELARRDELVRDQAARDHSKDFRPH